MLTVLLLLFPVAAALLLHFAKGQAARVMAFGASLVEFALAIFIAVTSQHTARAQFEVNVPWIASAGINFHVGIDGLSLLLVLLTTFLVPLIILASFRHDYPNASAFYALILFMQTGLIGVFISLDAFLFYFFWEVALIPIYFLAGIWGSERRIQVTFKFFLYTIIGSLFMLAAFVYLYFQTGVNGAMRSSDIIAFYNLNLSAAQQAWLFWLIFIAFAVKMPIFPFHTWQPDTYTESPAPATMLLSGIMLKMGIYGCLRWLLPIVPKGVSQWDKVVMILAVIGIIYGAIIAIRQRDMKRLIAYSSLSHVGLMAAGVFSITLMGMQGAVVQMLAHGINVVGMFFIADIIQRRTNTRQIPELGGLTRSTPLLSVTFLVILLGTVALPLTNGFVGEFLLLGGVYQYNNWLGAVAGLTIIFAAVYLLRMFQRVMLGPDSSFSAAIRDLSGSELAVLIPLIIMVFWIGLFPNVFLRISEPAILQIITMINR
ncbi:MULTISPECIES: complex I subunit 4 family protein [Hymenobacter]|uniref:NADH-quinone oxidoreductase subunit M n=1 Tax=Hymenobacter jejuensis TaxID=2502781 RepID=A0A5B7ZYK1_9BACT|nr:MULTISPECIES: NADH-quinone oxidoreductase subunit M [Hymenobacter]MBC6988046.1 NADH-quinone oxidoreductase subunit M [Hymenobacter sp. BT491]QDA59576.1 NADH-quinone oxidoreductase subunit M [Hymenobacter jejuensis]